MLNWPSQYVWSLICGVSGGPINGRLNVCYNIFKFVDSTYIVLQIKNITEILRNYGQMCGNIGQNWRQKNCNNVCVSFYPPYITPLALRRFLYVNLVVLIILHATVVSDSLYIKYLRKSVEEWVPLTRLFDQLFTELDFFQHFFLSIGEVKCLHIIWCRSLCVMSTLQKTWKYVEKSHLLDSISFYFRFSEMVESNRNIHSMTP